MRVLLECDKTFAQLRRDRRARRRFGAARVFARAPVVRQRGTIKNSVVRDKARVLDRVRARSEGRENVTRRALVRVRTGAADIRNGLPFGQVVFPEQIKAKFFSFLRQDLGFKGTAVGLFHFNGMVELEIVVERLGDYRSADLSAKVGRRKRQRRRRGAPGVQSDRIRFRLLTAEPFINQRFDFLGVRRVVKVRLRLGVDVRRKDQRELLQVLHRLRRFEDAGLALALHPTRHVIVPVLVFEQVIEELLRIQGFIVLIVQFDLPLDDDDIVVAAAVRHVHVHVRLVETHIFDAVVHEFVQHSLRDVVVDQRHGRVAPDSRGLHDALYCFFGVWVESSRQYIYIYVSSSSKESLDVLRMMLMMPRGKETYLKVSRIPADIIS